MWDTDEVWILKRMVEVSLPHSNFQPRVLTLMSFNEILEEFKSLDLGAELMKIWLSFNRFLPLYCPPKLLYCSAWELESRARTVGAALVLEFADLLN